MLDPISDMLTRIRNAQRVGHKEVVMPFSNLKMAILNILKGNGFIDSVEKESEGKFENLIVGLKYEKITNTKVMPVISGIKRVSKEGQRVYVKNTDIGKVKNSFGISVISTSKGVMSGDDARKNGLGGEVICEVW